jgi:hypothetical protein
MSEKLRDILNQHQNLKALNNFLSSCDSIMFIEHTSASESPSPLSIWKIIAGFDINTTKKMPITSSLIEVSEWFQEELWKLNITKEIYISIGGLSGLSWTKIKILSEKNWLLQIWEHENHEIIVLNDQKNQAICLLEEEYFWEIYILQI